MNLNNLEQHVLAYFLAVEASKANVDGRYFRREGFVKIFDDMISFSVERFGGRVATRQSNVATGLVDALIEDNGFVTSHDQYSGTSYQFDRARYRAAISRLQAADAICKQAEASGPEFWVRAFETLNRE